MRVTVGSGRKKLQLTYPDDAPVRVVTALQSLAELAPDLHRRCCDSEGRIRRALEVFVNSEHVRYRDGLETRLSDGDELYIIPLIAGG
jgi:molybdopterin converting factor small subunit